MSGQVVQDSMYEPPSISQFKADSEKKMMLKYLLERPGRFINPRAVSTRTKKKTKCGKLSKIGTCLAALLSLEQLNLVVLRSPPANPSQKDIWNVENQQKFFTGTIAVKVDPSWFSETSAEKKKVFNRSLAYLDISKEEFHRQSQLSCVSTKNLPRSIKNEETKKHYWQAVCNLCDAIYCNKLCMCLNDDR